eukprot:gene9563-10570_t
MQIHNPVSYHELSSTTWKFFRSIAAESFQVPKKQVPRVLFHGLILACIIAGFWLIDSLKDPVLASTVGIEYQPMAKFLSVLTTLLVVCIYDFLTSIVTKPALFHIVSSFFGLVMMMIAALLTNEDIGLVTTTNGRKGPHRLLGWIAYFTIEAYGSLMTALFWSFTNSIMDLEQAKGAYGLIIAIAQIGAILGSTLATNSNVVGIPGLFIFGAMLIFSVSLLIKSYHVTYKDYITESNRTRVRSISESQTVDPILPPVQEEEEVLIAALKEKVKAKESTLWKSFGRILSNFYEGLYLIAQHGYVSKLLGVACLYEIVMTILDYEFKVMGAQASSSSSSASDMGDSDRFANLLGHFGQLTNLLSFFLSFFGFSYLVHHIGVDKSLMVFPITLLIAVIVTYLAPQLYVLFFFLSLLKGMIFSLHDPVKELLYIPTSESIKFKAKAWIDVFGSRLAKASGSVITSFAAGDAVKLNSIGEIPALFLTIVIIFLTWSMGKDFQRLVESNTIVGEPEGRLRYSIDLDGPIIDGLRPGDVGYSGYDPELFEGVFDDIDFNIDEQEHNPEVEMTVLSKGMQALVDAKHMQQAIPFYPPLSHPGQIVDSNRARTRSAHL